jgi:uncharacterized membrane protein
METNMSASKTTLSFAAAAAMFALSGAVIASPAMAKEAPTAACYGVNSCKGQSDCKSFNHDCKAQNDCKGQGFKTMTPKACAAAGGSLTAPK